MVSILEPFIDTIVICTVTGLVILSSGVWAEKLDNEFQRADMRVVSGVYVEENEAHQRELIAYLSSDDSTVAGFNGSLQVIDGRIQNQADVTVINSRSFAENVLFSLDGEPVTGELAVSDGRLDDQSVVVSGESLLHSVPLTTEAFTRGLFGNYGQYIVSIGLMLFAFSTAIAWSYYGDRAMTYLLGPRSVFPYRVVYVCGFFYAARRYHGHLERFADYHLLMTARPIGLLAHTCK